MKVFQILTAILDLLRIYFSPPFDSNGQGQGTKILVVTGRPYWYRLKTEVIDVTNENFTCKLPNFPIDMYVGAGGMINDEVLLVCGGVNGTRISDCFKLKDKVWSKSTSLRTSKYNMGTGNLVYKNKLIISGGFDGATWTYRSVERLNEISMIDTNSRITTNMTLPIPLSSHCNAWINETHFMVTGGNSQDRLQSKTLIINVENGQIIKGPYMNHGRAFHGCTKVLIGNVPFIVVTGGDIRSSWHNTDVLPEFLDLTNLNLGWKEGKELPIQLSSHRMVSSLDLKRAYIIGGFGGKEIGDARSEILELECSGPNPETCEFKQVKAKLQNARYGHVAVPITDTFVNKNCE